MNKNVLQKFAIEARRELIEKIKNKAFEYGIQEDQIKKGEIESSDSIVVNGKALNKDQKEQRRKLIEKIESLNEQGSNGFDVVIEEVGYTWFNRLIALRFMEVNRYIKTRALSSEEGSKIPDIVTEALDVSFKNVELDEDYIRELKLSSDINATQDLFKYMIISQCNELHDTLPFMFEKISDYTELLFPDGLLDENSFVSKMTDNEYIPEEDWEEVEIIGWLYQYYIAEEKDRVIKAKKKYKKEEIPFATQLFTPKWIVKYMVQNSLGRYWIESHPEDEELKKEWEFYLENPEKEPDFEEKIAPYINKELNVEDIKCFDPACGSGNFLIVTYRELRLLEYKILEKIRSLESNIKKWKDKQTILIPGSITKIKIENFYGIEIDEFSSKIAQVSMWFIEHQMNLKYESLDLHEDNLPLKQYVNIKNENSLRIDWKEVVQPDNNVYIIGNPPFRGKQKKTLELKEDMKLVFKGFENIGTLDYVTAWYKKALDYMKGTKIESAFVSTNSICQGEQVPNLWIQLREKYDDFYINFAHRTFRWKNEAKKNASVFCVIIGFSF